MPIDSVIQSEIFFLGIQAIPCWSCSKKLNEVCVRDKSITFKITFLDVLMVQCYKSGATKTVKLHQLMAITTMPSSLHSSAVHRSRSRSFDLFCRSRSLFTYFAGAGVCSPILPEFVHLRQNSGSTYLCSIYLSYIIISYIGFMQRMQSVK